MLLHPRLVAQALGGIVTGNTSILVPGPGHSSSDRSLSIKIDPIAPDGFIVYSFAGDSAAACRDHVRAALGLRTSKPKRKPPQLDAGSSPFVGTDRSADRSAVALRIWREASDPRGTVVANYLSSRGLILPDDAAGSVVRFHPALSYNGGIVGGMIALFRDIHTDTQCGLHRTFLDSDGRKLDRRMLGRAKRAAIKIDADENVTMGLTIGEGIETGLAASLGGFRPVWALGSVGGIAAFPVLSGIDAITILGEIGDNGANRRASQACVERWIEAGREGFIATPLVGADLNDAWRNVAP
jgi:hypothetical protein